MLATPHNSPDNLDPPLTEANPAAARPFLIELRQEQKTRAGYFQPQAFLKLGAAWRTSGFVLALSGDDLKHLLFLLSFVNPNSDVRAALPQLAEAMRVSPAKARSRMRRLAEVGWQDKPLVMAHRTESGLELYGLHPELVAYEHSEQPVPEPAVPSYRAAGREAVIAHSRQRYARPRREVERLIAEQNGWPLPDEEKADSDDSIPTGSGGTSTDVLPDHQLSQVAYVKQQLLRLGMDGETADDLLRRFGLVRIQRQLQWLPYRRVRNPAGFLIAAIEDNYEAPSALRYPPPAQADMTAPLGGDDTAVPTVATEGMSPDSATQDNVSDSAIPNQSDSDEITLPLP